jgi:hypothetical protein
MNFVRILLVQEEREVSRSESGEGDDERGEK